jgi:hypothetical protein
MADALRFSAPNGDAFVLRIAGYQFPELADAPYDSNWLIVDGEATLAGRSWRFRDPCLLTYEAASLAAWFEQQAEGGAVGDEIGFLEPNLNFERPSLGVIRVRLAAEAKPAWAGVRDTCIDTPAGADALRAAADALRAALTAFPQRTPV